MVLIILPCSFFLSLMTSFESCRLWCMDSCLVSFFFSLMWKNRILFYLKCCICLSSNILLQAVHVAAQYGQTAFLNHIIAKYHADFDVPDNDGRSPLHWYVNKLCSIVSHIDLSILWLRLQSFHCVNTVFMLCCSFINTYWYWFGVIGGHCHQFILVVLIEFQLENAWCSSEILHMKGTNCCF